MAISRYPQLCYDAFMCGRYTLTIDRSTIEKRFGARFVSGHFEPTYNAAPSQLLPIIRTHARDRVELAKWGFWPEGWKLSKTIRPLINARIETADEKRMFHDSFRGRRGNGRPALVTRRDHHRQFSGFMVNDHLGRSA
jgi:hypothetical protein